MNVPHVRGQVCDDWVGHLVGFQTDMAGVIALLQLVNFAKLHQKEFMNMFKCETCLQRIISLEGVFNDVLTKGIDQQQLAKINKVANDPDKTIN